MTISPDSDTGRIMGIALVVAKLEAAIAFYSEGLGFALEGRSDAGGNARAALSLGGVMLRLDQPSPPGRPYPVERSANDPWFQHFAIRVSDMDVAFTRLSSMPFTAISTCGPQQLPASAGSVIAFKFRDPDGHPLELSHYPGAPPPAGRSPFLTIDHSAIAVSDLDVSIAFYRDRLGFRVAEQLVNQGPTQWRLDGLNGAVVDIVVLKPPAAGPHLELLYYRTPSPAAPLEGIGPNDIAATRLFLSSADAAGDVLTDPDGHLVELVNPR